MRTNGSTSWRWFMDAAGAAICIGATLAFYLGGVRPLVQRYTEAESYQSSINAQRKVLSQLTATFVTEQNCLAEAKRALANSPFQLESSADINKRIARIAGLASDCKLKLDEIRPDAPISGLRYETVAIHIIGEGNYRTCVALLYRLRQVFPDTTVTSFTLRGNPNDHKAVASFTIDLLWYAAANVHAKKN